MQHFKVIVLSCFLTACATGGVSPNVQRTKTAETIVEEKSTVKSSDDISVFAAYLRNYVAINIGDRARTSRSLIDRSGIEGNGRLPSKSLFQSLGYRVRDAYVSMPPELLSRPFKSIENSLYGDQVQSLETTWALLDSTQARLQSEGGLEVGRQDWEVAIVRRNLLLEAIGYWYQLRNQENHTDWLLRLGDKSDALFNEISDARENYDVQDLRSQELVLLSLRTDVAELFQFHTSEQARLYNRIERRILPEGNTETPTEFTNKLECEADDDIAAKGVAYLNRYYSKQVNAIRSSKSTKVSVYELNELARKVSTQALALRAERLSSIEQSYRQKAVIAQQVRVKEIELLEKRYRALIEIGQDADLNEIELLKNSPLTVLRDEIKESDAELAILYAVKVLADWVSNNLLVFNQQRLNTVLANQASIYDTDKNKVWLGVTQEAKVIHGLLHEVYDFTLVDYLIGYERLAFMNQAMLRNCEVDVAINSKVIGFDPQSIDRLATLTQSHYHQGLNRPALKVKLNYYQKIIDVFTAKILGDGYSIPAVVDTETEIVEPAFTYSGEEKRSGLVTLKQKEFERIKTLFSEQGFSLASKDDVLEFVKGEGYTVQVAATESVTEAIGLVRRFQGESPTLIYRSLRKGSEEKLLKVLVGKRATYDEATAFQKSIDLGWVKPFKSVRNDIYDD